jgi:predicted Zn-dependent peptidase
MLKKIAIFSALSLAFCSQSFAQKPQHNNISFVEYNLPNGLHVILHQDNSVPIVATTVLYKVGSKDEKADRTGFAHFFEHLLFEGSENMGRGDFDKHLDNAGGTNNANTWYDRTFYYEIVPSNQIQLTLWLESERMLHAKVETKGIETQRQVVKEERRLRVDNQPYGRILEETMKLAYQTHPYKSSVIGSMAHLDAAKDEDYKSFYKTFYVPNNATLSIAGDINIEETKKMILQYFGDIPKGATVPRTTLQEAPQTEEIRGTAYDNIQLPAVIHAFKTPGISKADFYAVNMLFKILSDGKSSRLYKNIKDKQQKALQIGSFPLSLEDNPSVGITFAIANQGVTPEDLEAALEVEYEKLKTELVSEEEFQKLINQIERDFVTQNDGVATIAENLANYHTYYGSAKLVNTEIDEYMKVKRQDIQRVAQKYLAKTNRTTLYYLPKAK